MPLTKDEIRLLLSDIENERVERTLSTDNTKKMSEVICAFANDIRNTKKPGYFMIGADDDGNLDGADIHRRTVAFIRRTPQFRNNTSTARYDGIQGVFS